VCFPEPGLEGRHELIRRARRRVSAVEQGVQPERGDVLAARQLLVGAQTAYSRSRYDYVLNVLRLKQAAGILDRKALEDVNAWLENPPPPANPPVVTPAPPPPQ